ncbi:MAG TPA: phosphoribosyltransferase family protein [Thermogutta sp.]|nr:phosphoribosyltransferase family protein [Thermogutta sp.]HQF14065.1 phosphoribosyltransferase family protein [Thermogutta sp.]
MNVLIDEATLQAGLDRLAAEIEKRYRGKPLTLVGVLLGSIVFLADLMRRLTIPYGVEMISSRQVATESNIQGPLFIQADLLAPEVAGRHVLIIDDIYDTGETLWELIPQFDDFKVASVHAAVLLKKKNRQRVPLGPTLVGFEIPDVYVVGYGMDYRGYYRNLPYIASLSPEEMKNLAQNGG